MIFEKWLAGTFTKVITSLYLIIGSVGWSSADFHLNMGKAEGGRMEGGGWSDSQLHTILCSYMFWGSWFGQKTDSRQVAGNHKRGNLIGGTDTQFQA